MKKGFIFDLDGVICFTDEYHYLAWKALADSEGIYFDKTINLRLKGVSRMDSLDIILERANKTYTQEEKIAMATKKNEIYCEYLQKMSPKDVTQEVVDTLKKLKEMGIKISLGSSSKNAKLILTKIGLLDMFDAIADGTDITKSKPDPEVFLCAAKKLGFEPKDCCVVEDAKAGIDAAKAGGFTAIGIDDAAGYELTDHPIKTFKDILKYTD